MKTYLKTLALLCSLLTLAACSSISDAPLEPQITVNYSVMVQG
jgi:hypothetical protein